MNDIVSPKVLVVAGSRPKQFDDHILPAMNGLGLTVVRVVSRHEEQKARLRAARAELAGGAS